MKRDEVFDAWAPRSARWSNWVKPVVFAHVQETWGYIPPADPSAGDIAQAPNHLQIPPADRQTAIVVDLPGDQSVRFSLVLAHHGYRPVPLFNSVPGPRFPLAAAPSQVVVNMSAVADALAAGAPILNALSLRDSAPPAFCLDSRRRIGDGVLPQAGVFDNRSISLPADFPSANLLRSEGVGSAMIVMTGNAGPEADLCHTLRRWQQAGIELSSIRLDSDEPPQPLIVRRPALFGKLWYACLAAMGLRPHLLGGFGGYLPDPSTG